MLASIGLVNALLVITFPWFLYLPLSSTGAIDLVAAPVSKAKIEALQAEIAFKRAELISSIRYYESGLQRLGVRVPKTWFGYGVGVARESIIQCLHSLFQKRLHWQPPRHESILTVRLLGHLSNNYGFCSIFKMCWAHLESINRAERLPRSQELAFSYAQHAGAMTLIGWYSRGLKYCKRSIELRREFNDVWGLGHAHCWMGIGLYASARFEEGVEILTKAVDFLSKTGDQWELNMARFHLGCCHYRLGNMAEALNNARATFETSIRIGDSRSHCSLRLWSTTAEGNLPFPDLESSFCLAEEDIVSTANFLIGKGRWYLSTGRTEEAEQVLEKAWKMATKNLMVTFHTLASLTWLVTVLRKRREQLSAEEQPLSAELLKRALRLAKTAAWLSRLFPCERPQALRELSLLYAAKGRTKKALKFAKRSCFVAELQKAKYEFAQSALVRTKLKHSLGLPGATAEVEQAEAALEPFEKMIEEAVAKNSVTLSSDAKA